MTLAYNGSGTFLINSTGQPVVSGTTISATVENALTADLATGLTTALCKDGQSTPTANLKMGGFKLTGLGVATTSGDALSYGQAATVTTLTATGAIAGTTITATSPGGASMGSGNYSAPGVSLNGDSGGGATLSLTGFATSIQLSIGGLTSQNAAGLNMVCVSNGVTLANGATAWAAICDETMKTKIVPFANALDRISRMRAGTARYLTDPDSVSRSFLSAQSVQAVLPEAVRVKVADEKQPTPWDGKLMLAVTDVIPLLVAALAEANARLKALEAA